MNCLNNEDQDQYEERTWVPPSDAEQKIIEARRERNNKISSLMGQYLLKGYKMLAITCAHCDCILLEDRQKKKYCIACSEIDADSKKDNPAVSAHAARRTVEESQHRHLKDEQTEGELMTNSLSPNPSAPLLTAPAKLKINGSVSESKPVNVVAEVSQTIELPHNQQKVNSDFSAEIKETKDALRQKLQWFTNSLKDSENLQECHQLIRLIEGTATALSSVQNLNNSI